MTANLLGLSFDELLSEANSLPALPANRNSRNKNNQLLNNLRDCVLRIRDKKKLLTGPYERIDSLDGEFLIEVVKEIYTKLLLQIDQKINVSEPLRRMWTGTGGKFSERSKAELKQNLIKFLIKICQKLCEEHLLCDDGSYLFLADSKNSQTPKYNFVIFVQESLEIDAERMEKRGFIAKLMRINHEEKAIVPLFCRPASLAHFAQNRSSPVHRAMTTPTPLVLDLTSGDFKNLGKFVTDFQAEKKENRSGTIYLENKVFSNQENRLSYPDPDNFTPEELLSHIKAGLKKRPKPKLISFAGSRFSRDHIRILLEDVQVREIVLRSLSFVSFQSVDLTGINLEGACLFGADLRSTKLLGANLSYANLSKAIISDRTKIDDKTKFLKTILPAELPGSFRDIVKKTNDRLESFIKSLEFESLEEQALAEQNLEASPDLKRLRETLEKLQPDNIDGIKEVCEQDQEVLAIKKLSGKAARTKIEKIYQDYLKAILGLIKEREPKTIELWGDLESEKLRVNLNHFLSRISDLFTNALECPITLGNLVTKHQENETSPLNWDLAIINAKDQDGKIYPTLCSSASLQGMITRKKDLVRRDIVGFYYQGTLFEPEDISKITIQTAAQESPNGTGLTAAAPSSSTNARSRIPATETRQQNYIT